MIKFYYKSVSIFLSLNLLIVQIIVATPQKRSGVVHVGYVGESLKGISSLYSNLVRKKMLGLTNQNYYEFHNPVDLADSHSEAVSIVLGYEKDTFLDGLASLSNDANLDYIFVTSLENISDTKDRVMLKGEVVRYNRRANDIYRYEILSYAEDIDLHIKAIKEEMVQTIPHSVYGIEKNRKYLVIGMVLVLVFALSQSFGGFGQFIGGDADGDGKKGTEPPPGN